MSQITILHARVVDKAYMQHGICLRQVPSSLASGLAVKRRQGG
jgi:hypothetical protein